MIPEEWKNFEKFKVNEILTEIGSFRSIKAPIPIQYVIESYVADVNFVTKMDYPFPEGVSALTTKDMDIGWLIIINGREIIERQRFSAAHELGHLVLFKNQPSKVFCSDDNGWNEKLCDRFAGDILMPDALIHELYKSNPSPYIEDVAKLFRVSKPVAEIQLKRLGVPFQRKEQAF
jgi:Zn-dependent peptidase ImmA (M78 family)